jgi:thiol-disulfide isomerase/thioredoxin
MPKGKRKTTAGRVSVPVDVRKSSDIPAFENMLGLGPITLVLVYADWCGHCQRFKHDMWDEVTRMPNKTINTASVHYDMMDKTSLAPSKIDGYPSLLLVGKDKKAAEYTLPNGTITNAIPTPTNKEQLTQIVNTPVPQENRIPEEMNGSIQGSLTTVLPPSSQNDILENTSTANGSMRPGLRGGNLYSSLLQITQDATPAALLLASSLLSKKTRRNKRGKKRTLRSKYRKQR